MLDCRGYSAVRNYTDLIVWLVLYNYDPSAQISQVVGGVSIILFVKFRMRWWEADNKTLLVTGAKATA